MARLASPRVFLLRKRAQRGGQPHSPAVRGAQRHSLRGNVGITLKSVCVVSGISPLAPFFFSQNIDCYTCVRKRNRAGGRGVWLSLLLCVSSARRTWLRHAGQTGFSWYFRSFSAPLHLCHLALPPTVGGWQRQKTRRWEQAG